MSSEALLELEDVVVRYGGVVAVDHVSFALPKGEIYGLVGPNGSGKSTLLAAISGTRTADEGSIRLDGVDVRKWPSWRLARSGLSRTFQGSRVVPGMTVLENVLLGFDWNPSRRSSPFGKRSRAAARAADDALETCGITNLRNAIAVDLSYGMQRLVEIARAIVGGPQILLLDEPTAGMNDRERGEIEHVQHVLSERGVTQVLVEHNMDMVMRVCSHLFVINSGVLISSGPPATVVNDPLVQRAYLGKARSRVPVASGN